MINKCLLGFHVQFFSVARQWLNTCCWSALQISYYDACEAMVVIVLSGMLLKQRHMFCTPPFGGLHSDLILRGSSAAVSL